MPVVIRFPSRASGAAAVAVMSPPPQCKKPPFFKKRFYYGSTIVVVESGCYYYYTLRTMRNVCQEILRTQSFYAHSISLQFKNCSRIQTIAFLSTSFLTLNKL